MKPKHLWRRQKNGTKRYLREHMHYLKMFDRFVRARDSEGLFLSTNNAMKMRGGGPIPWRAINAEFNKRLYKEVKKLYGGIK